MMKAFANLIKKIFAVFPVFFLVCATVSSAQESRSVQIKGSDTMVNLGQAWAEVFMGHHPEALLAVTGGGSGTGIAALLNGTCDIAQSSRKISEKEYALASEKFQNVQEIPTAMDAVAFVVHPDNPVKQVTIEQLSDIFTGKMENWKELGGEDKPILALSRERNSGTHVYVLEDVVRKGNPKGPEEFAPSVLMMPSSQAIEQEVSSNRAAIGYFGLGYLSPHLRALAVREDRTGEFIAPGLESALDGSYPVSRPLYFYLPGEPRGLVKEFIDFVLSEEGQAVVLDMQFVPLRKDAPQV
ncbi:MAG: phosphate ABC transporter substrate-binding protein [Candidatus Omnitrophica bacterium]|nr:phosphate ABC transporter substrate-binding protein [Candidatus Omnitrophota bacterium]